MKRTTSTIIFAALMLAALISCKKEDDSKETTTTTTASNPSTGINPLSVKACNGKGSIELNNVRDTLVAREAILPPLNLFGIYCDATSGSLTLQSGDNKLPATTKTYTIMGDPDKLPGASQMVLAYYDEQSGVDYYATSGTVTYTISANEKTVTFSSITFKGDTGTKTISFEVALK